MVSSGTKVSPMQNFFIALGFPSVFLNRLNKDYEDKFDPKYRAGLFPGIEKLLHDLKKSGVLLGLVTSNSEKNVKASLGSPVIKLFQKSSLFFREQGESKSHLIVRAMESLDVEGGECVYVGDQPDDLYAAREAGCCFVGVSYGWGFNKESIAVKLADSPRAIFAAVREVIRSFPLEPQFEYAWNWFSYHADQRVKMFNYMFVGLGLFATAIITAIDKGLYKIIPITLSLIAGALAIAFYFLDKRNEYLVRLGEDVLFSLEKQALFGSSAFMRSRFSGRVTKGILLRQHRENPTYRGLEKKFDDAIHGRHRFWLRGMALLLALMFVAAALALLFSDAKPTESNTLEMIIERLKR